MPNKFDRKHLAVGAWNSTWRFARAQQVPEKIRVLLQDKLITRGLYVDLYNPVGPQTPGVVDCTCVKNTTDQADHACQTCHGVKKAPGYVRFLHQTQFWCSAEDTSFSLNNVTLFTAKKANVLVLSPGSTTGTIVTQDKAFSNPGSVNWDVKLDAYRRANGTTFVLEYSIDAGSTWHTVSLTEVPNPGIGFIGTISGSAVTGTGSIRFRITMTRVSANDLAPAFEIVRLRRPLPEHENKQIIRVRPDHQTCRILVLRPWTVENDSLDAGRGRLTLHEGDKTWTSPLDFFDTSLTHDTPACRIQDFSGPHPFYQYANGVQQGTRYALLSCSFNETFGVFTHQSLTDRRVQDQEAYSLVW